MAIGVLVAICSSSDSTTLLALVAKDDMVLTLLDLMRGKVTLPAPAFKVGVGVPSELEGLASVDERATVPEKLTLVARD